MDKININSFGTSGAPSVVYLQVGEGTVEVMRRIPYSEVLNAIQWSVNLIIDERTFISAPIAAIIEDVAIAKFYSNIDVSMFNSESFDIEAGYKFYDIVSDFDGFNKIKDLIDEKQLKFFHDNLWKTMESIVTYRNSAAGILERLSFQAKSTSTNIEQAIQDSGAVVSSENIQKLMEVMNKLSSPVE